MLPSDLRDVDFEWATATIIAAAGEHLNGPLPVVSILEGGYGRYDEQKKVYDRKSLWTGAAAHVRALGAHVQNTSIVE